MSDTPKRPRGRPRKSPARAAAYTKPRRLDDQVRFEVRIERAEMADLEAKAAAANVTKSEFVRRLIRENKIASRDPIA